jgi:hypothetical protein
VLTPVVLQLQVREEPAPARPSPTSPHSGATVSGQVVWSEALPGLDLPLGRPLGVTYGAGSSIFVEGSELEWPAGSVGTVPDARLAQVADTPLGVLAVVVDRWFSSVHLLDGQGIRDIGGAAELTGMVVLDPGADQEAKVAFAIDDGGVQKLLAGPLPDPQAVLVEKARRQPVGFLDGDPVVALLDEPGSVEVVSQEPDGGQVHVQSYAAASPLGDNAVPAGSTTIEDDLQVVFSDLDTGCSYAYRVPGTGEPAWMTCDNARGAVMIVGPRYGAVGTNVYDVVDGALVTGLELPEASRFDIAPIGWETPTALILRVISYEAYGEAKASGATMPPRYAAVRCRVDSGVCERLPHPVDVIAGATP